MEGGGTTFRRSLIFRSFSSFERTMVTCCLMAFTAFASMDPPTITNTGSLRKMSASSRTCLANVALNMSVWRSSRICHMECG